MAKCKCCGLDAGTHACDPKDVTINMAKQNIAILRQQVTALEARNKELEALAEQPTQEPVAWQALCGDNHYAYGTAEIDLKGYHSDFWQRPLYTHPKQWQGVSDDEIIPMYNEPSSDAEMIEFARAIEAKLRIKNGY